LPELWRAFIAAGLADNAYEFVPVPSEHLRHATSHLLAASRFSLVNIRLCAAAAAFLASFPLRPTFFAGNCVPAFRPSPSAFASSDRRAEYAGATSG